MRPSPGVTPLQNEDQRNYGMAIAAMSQYAHGLGMTTRRES